MTEPVVKYETSGVDIAERLPIGPGIDASLYPLIVQVRPFHSLPLSRALAQRVGE